MLEPGCGCPAPRPGRAAPPGWSAAPALAPSWALPASAPCLLKPQGAWASLGPVLPSHLATKPLGGCPPVPPYVLRPLARPALCGSARSAGPSWPLLQPCPVPAPPALGGPGPALGRGLGWPCPRCVCACPRRVCAEWDPCAAPQGALCSCRLRPAAAPGAAPAPHCPPPAGVPVSSRSLLPVPGPRSRTPCPSLTALGRAPLGAFGAFVPTGAVTPEPAGSLPEGHSPPGLVALGCSSSPASHSQGRSLCPSLLVCLRCAFRLSQLRRKLVASVAVSSAPEPAFPASARGAHPSPPPPRPSGARAKLRTQCSSPPGARGCRFGGPSSSRPQEARAAGPSVQRPVRPPSDRDGPAGRAADGRSLGASCSVFTSPAPVRRVHGTPSGRSCCHDARVGGICDGRTVLVPSVISQPSWPLNSRQSSVGVRGTCLGAAASPSLVSASSAGSPGVPRPLSPPVLAAEPQRESCSTGPPPWTSTPCAGAR